MDGESTNYCCNKCGQTFRLKTSYERHRKRAHSLPQKMYSCNVCNKQFRKFLVLKRHSALHVPLVEYECSVCKTEFTRKENIERHLSSAHDIHKIECQMCGKGFAFRHDAVDHIRAQHRDFDLRGCTVLDDKNKIIRLDFPCNECDETFITYSDLRAHKDQQHKPVETPRMVRSMRNLKFKKGVKKSLVLELAKKITLKNKPQPKRDLNLKSKAQSQNKKPTRNDLKCTVCLKEFRQVYSVHRHLRNVHNKEPSPAKPVVKNVTFEVAPFSSENGIKSEPVSDEPNDDDEAVCPLCNKVFDKNINLSRHLKNFHFRRANQVTVDITPINTNSVIQRSAASAEKPSFVASPKPKSSILLRPKGVVTPKLNLLVSPKSPNNLPTKPNCASIKKPIISAAGQTKIASNISPRSNIQINNRDVLPTEPVKLKPFQCKICKVRFGTQDILDTHIETKHFNKCGYCNRTFSEKNYLEAHMRSTHADKLFMCPFPPCTTFFQHPYHLDQHVKLMHHKLLPVKSNSESPTAKLKIPLMTSPGLTLDRKSHQCTICKRVLSSASVLKRHRRLVHKEKN